MNAEVKELLQLTIKNGGSDLHFLAGATPSIRVDGTLRHITHYQELTNTQIETMVNSLLTPEQKELLLANKEIDFSFGFGGGAYGDLGRFRCNAYFQRGSLAAALRFLPPKILTIEELHLPVILNDFSKLKQGFVLITGPTGHGKSSTLAAIINEINLRSPSHILTIEDPIEYVYPKGESIISQREMDTDSHSWALALRSALREDLDVILVGEMRDADTMAAALTLAETGHLVFSTLHTNSASQSIDRIIDSFPAHQQPQIRIQLAATLRGVISQRLLPQIGQGRIPALELLMSTTAVASNIRDGKTHLIDSIIQTSKDVGMITMEESLSKLVRSGSITLETAKGYALHADELLRLIG
ncbi:MAG TPA: PilT/PilU family type 4a pilus ATPase [Patescibacteria group bacterium]|nr:PilT/PilU family type 4a pilus ATPase [Patescibacteria group bacterium]